MNEESPSSAALQSAILSKRPVQVENHLTVTFPPLETPDPSVPPRMFFATENNTAVTSQTGSNALLPCVIRNLDDGVVSLPLP